MPQGSAAWYQARLGIPTASMFHKIITPGGKPSSQADAYMNRLIAERLLNESMDDPLHVEWVEHGKAEQPNAISQFQFAHDLEIEEVGFVTDDAGKLGCSPDYLVKGRNEAVEIKCPKPSTHVGYLLDGPGNDYRPQVQGQLYVGGFEAVHFYSWHARCPPCEVTTEIDYEFREIMIELLDEFLQRLEDRTALARAMGTWVPMTIVEAPHAATAPGAEPVQNVIEAG
jgi:hypothetical protein